MISGPAFDSAAYKAIVARCIGRAEWLPIVFQDVAIGVLVHVALLHVAKGGDGGTSTEEDTAAYGVGCCVVVHGARVGATDDHGRARAVVKRRDD